VAKVGFMGTDSLASYTMMGDMVNLAARLEAAAKDYGTKILVSDAIYAVCKDKFHFRYMDKIRVKGKEQPVEIYSLESTLEEKVQNEVEGAKIYFESFQLYLGRNWQKAIQGFEEAEKVFNRKDKASRMLMERCQNLSENPPPENWDGVYTRTVK
jgi:adenylate cyclase